MRQMARRLLPEEISARGKQGFSAPDASWFKGESIDYVNQLLRGRSASIYEFLGRVSSSYWIRGAPWERWASPGGWPGMTEVAVDLHRLVEEFADAIACAVCR